MTQRTERADPSGRLPRGLSSNLHSTAVLWEAERGSGGSGYRVQFVNDAARALLGYPLEAWSGADEFWIGIAHPDDRSRARRQLDDALGSSAGDPSLVRWMRADGTPISMEVHLAPVTNPAGTVVAVRGFALDASRWTRVQDELASLRAQLAHALRRATLNELVVSLVHEINQPLNAILNNAQAARLVLDGPDFEVDELAAMLDAIVAADERANQIIRRARGLAGYGDGEGKPIDLNAVVADVCELLGSEALLRNVVMTPHPAPGACVVTGDRVQLTQVVVNLATNALDAVSHAPVAKRTVQVDVIAPPGDWAGVAVIDSGQGIPPAMRERIFEPMVSSKPDGLGLGLGIASLIVGRSGGSMWAGNNRDAGAHFVIALPRMERAAAALGQP